jgi:hypothetical protein
MTAKATPVPVLAQGSSTKPGQCMLVKIKEVYDDLDHHISSAPCNLQHILEAADGNNDNVNIIMPP